MGMLKEFKEFAMKGSLVDIAVAFVMGAAFGKVITAFTEGLVAPLITLITGGANFNDKAWILRQSTEVKDAAGKVVSGDPAVALQWGTFVTNVIDFIIVAFVMFLIIKAINKSKNEAPPAPAEPSSTDKLLMEIRDSLKK
ncbi:MAG: large conductance mechanosensitive channel protein MscL [Sphingobacteriales bacterium]|nr:large conductance mechanosensitive channel protein MscL [Sphingobacteriales bacterium]MBI3720662.1 large conductance mechanosensitive channel protein MscL [Sphingobacteriales bacterium]